jgi:hypothetical protein
LALLASFALASYLLFTPVGHVTVDVELKSAALSFTPAGKGQLLDALPLREASVLPGSSFRIWVAPPKGPQDRATNGGTPLALQRIGILDGSLTAQPFALDGGGKLGLEVVRGGRGVELTATRTPEVQILSGYGALELVSDSASLPANLALPTTIELQGGEILRWQILPRGKRAALLSQPIPVRDVTFTRSAEQTEGLRQVIEEVSSVQAGTLAVRLGEHTYALLPGDRLEMEGFEGLLRDLVFVDGMFQLHLTGRVRDLRIGPEAKRIMPSLLEALHERSSLSLFWGSALWILGLLFTLERWWHPKE